MPETMPPPDTGGSSSEPGWYADPETPGVMRWWDGTGWSASDIRMAGEEGLPWWHPSAVRESFLPRTRFGSVIALLLTALEGPRSSRD